MAGPQDQQNTVINPTDGSVAHAPEPFLTGTDALATTLDALRVALATLITLENQEARKAEIEELEKQVTRIREEIQVEKEQMALEAARLVQEQSAIRQYRSPAC